MVETDKKPNTAKSRAQFVLKFALLLAITMLPVAAMAGAGSGGGEEFEEIWELLQDWVQGTLGRIFALLATVVGIAFGIAKSSMIAFVTGPAIGVGLYYAPTIIDSIMGAALVTVA